MRILYVDLQYDYGKKNRGVNQIGEFGFHQSFKLLGHEVICFYYDEYLNRLNELQTLLLQKADECKPDLIFFCLFTGQFYPATLQALKAKYKTMNWFGDDQWRFDKFSSKYAPLFTYTITTDDFAVEKYKKIGVENIISSQWAALEYKLTEMKASYKYDVSFVGGAHPVRKWIVSEFKKLGLEVTTFGNGWANGAVSLSEMQNIFQTSKINLNISNSINYDIRFLTHHPRNILLALKGTKDKSQIKARNFEIPYFGGFQLTEYVPSLESYFNIGREVICYSNLDEAATLIQHYLQNEVAREAIKKAGQARAFSEHTYRSRLEKVLTHVK